MTSQAIAEPNTILRCEAGSSVFGLSTEESSDRDELGICVEPAEYVIGLRHFEQWVHRTQPDGVRSGPGDLDLTVYSLRKFCSLALKGNPTILLLLFAPEEKCSIRTETGARLQRIAWAFASKKAGACFLGYMQQQRQRLLGERGQKNVQRPELVERYGYDTKYAGHIIRLGLQGVEYLQTGRFSVPMREPDRTDVLAVRRGEVDLNDVMTRAGELESEIKMLLETSPLYDDPDYAAVNQFLIDSYLNLWARG